MTVKCRIAFVLNSIIVLVGLLIGSSYLIRSDVTSYHREVIGVEWGSLAPGVQKLIIILMKGTGDAAIVTALSMALLLLIPFRRGENWSRWAILLIGLALLIPMLIGAAYLASTTGASSPWELNAALTIILFIGFMLSADLKKKP